MSRAMRRQPPVQKPPAKGTPFRPAGGVRARKPQVSAAAAAEAKTRRSFLERIPLAGRYVQEIINELKKVSWPTREETTRLTAAVIVVTVAIGLALGGVDIGFNWMVERTLLR